jgi:hypothetical protein
MSQALDQLVIKLEGDDGLMDHPGHVFGHTGQVLLGNTNFALVGQGLYGVLNHPHVAGHGREGVGQYLD